MFCKFKRFRCPSTNILIVLLLVASLFINGCGTVAVFGPKPEGPLFISKVDMEKFKSQRATREQVREHFGEPQFWDVKNESYCYYHREQERIRPTLLLICFFPIPAFEDVFYHQLVRFQFDSEGRVFDVKERWDSVTPGQSPFDDYCY